MYWAQYVLVNQALCAGGMDSTEYLSRFICIFVKVTGGIMTADHTKK